MSNSHRALGNVGHRLPAVFITRVLTWPGADTSHRELKPELRRGVQGTRGNLLVLAKKRTGVWPGAQAREGRKQDGAA